MSEPQSYRFLLRQAILSTSGDHKEIEMETTLSFMPWLGLTLKNGGVLSKPIADISYDIEHHRFEVVLEEIDLFHVARDPSMSEDEKKAYIERLNEDLKTFGWHHHT